MFYALNELTKPDLKKSKAGDLTLPTSPFLPGLFTSMNWSAKRFSPRGTASWCCPSGAARGWQRCSRRGVPTNGECPKGASETGKKMVIWYDLMIRNWGFDYKTINGESQESKLHGITGGMNAIAASYLGVNRRAPGAGWAVVPDTQWGLPTTGFAFLFTRIISKAEFRVANYTICTCMRVWCIYCIERHTYVWP